MSAVRDGDVLLPSSPAPVSRDGDEAALLARWLHNRSPHRIRAYQSTMTRFLSANYSRIRLRAAYHHPFD